MKLFICLIVLGALSAQAQTNQLRVVTNKPAPAPPPSLNDNISRAASNTPAFEQWAFKLMLGKANEVREKTGLNIPPLTASNVTFDAKPTAEGLRGSVSTSDKRYGWTFWNNDFQWFLDSHYSPQTFRYKDDESARLSKIRSKIDAKEAEAIARDYLHKIELTEKQLQCIEPPAINQYKFEESDGTVYPLPMFNVAWTVKGFEDDSPGIVKLDVSGITKAVAQYFNVAPKKPHTALPTNYYDMLGVKPPTNDSQRFGLRPLELLHPATNAPAK